MFIEKNEIVQVEENKDLYSALKSSLYPGAQDSSIQMVLSYCRAAKIDPMLKAVHIVPMRGRDVVMPGVGFYRIQAERSGSYAGISEPEFGPDITSELGGVKVTYPEWCKVTVKKIIQGHVCEFVAKEYWIENYATKGGDSKVPNSMWSKRPKAQLAKCSESQALRKAWPELIGSHPTAEEMEGKELIQDEYGSSLSAIQSKKPVNEAIKEKLQKNFIHNTYSQEEILVENQSVKVSSETLEKLKFLTKVCNVSEATINKWVKRANVSELSQLTEDQAQKVIEKLEEEAA